MISIKDIKTRIEFDSEDSKKILEPIFPGINPPGFSCEVKKLQSYSNFERDERKRLSSLEMKILLMLTNKHLTADQISFRCKEDIIKVSTTLRTLAIKEFIRVINPGHKPYYYTQSKGGQSYAMASNVKMCVGPEGATIDEVAQRVGISKGYASSILKSLKNSGQLTVTYDRKNSKRRPRIIYHLGKDV